MRRLKRFPPALGIFILIVLLVVAGMFHTGDRVSYSVQHPLVERLTDDEMRGEYDSLPAYRYVQVRDSIQQKVPTENRILLSSGSGWGGFSFGTSSHETEVDKEHYITFSGYWTTNSPASFYRRDGKTYVSFADDSNFIITQPTEVLYRSDNDGSDGKLMIPVSASTINLLNILHIVVALVFIAGYLFLLVTLLRILFNIAKGNVFTDENIGGLHAMAWMLIAIGTIPGLASVIAHWALHSRIPPGVNFYYWESLMQGSSFLIAGLCVLLLAKAFLKGSEIQEEQKLTI